MSRRDWNRFFKALLGTWAFLCVITGLLIVVAVAIDRATSRTDIAVDSSAVEWGGVRKINTGENGKTRYIAIPGIYQMDFISGEKRQNVNIYNPAENDCYMKFQLYVEDVLVWQSGYCEPGRGYYEIELDNELSAGNYKGRLSYECFTKDETQLNSADMMIDIIVR